MNKEQLQAWLLIGAVVLVLIGVFKYSPTPEPPVPPPGPPDPIPGAYVILLHETAERTPHITKVAEVFAARQAEGDTQLEWRVFDDDLAAVRDLMLLVMAEDGVDLPAIAFLTPVMEYITSFPLPETQEELDSLVKEVTGI